MKATKAAGLGTGTPAKSYVALGLALFGTFVAGKRLWFALAALAILVSGAIGGFHAGVEYGWWTGRCLARWVYSWMEMLVGSLVEWVWRMVRRGESMSRLDHVPL